MTHDFMRDEPGAPRVVDRNIFQGELDAMRVREKAQTRDGDAIAAAFMVVLVGIGYALVGIVFAVPTSHVRAWRLAAWAVCAVGYAAHIAYERFRLRNSPGSAALHVAFAVALGAFGLAVRANIHSLSTGSADRHRPLLLLALGIWPVMTALPAFLVALGANAILGRSLGNVRGK